MQTAGLWMPLVELGKCIMQDRNLRDPVADIGALVARIALRECAFLDELWNKRHPRPFDVLTKRRHRQFMKELVGYYACVCEDFLECEPVSYTHLTLPTSDLV